MPSEGPKRVVNAEIKPRHRKRREHMGRTSCAIISLAHDTCDAQDQIQPEPPVVLTHTSVLSGIGPASQKNSDSLSDGGTGHPSALKIADIQLYALLQTTGKGLEKSEGGGAEKFTGGTA